MIVDFSHPISSPEEKTVREREEKKSVWGSIQDIKGIF